MADRRPLISRSSDVSIPPNTTASARTLPPLDFTSHSLPLGFTPTSQARTPTSPPKSRPGYTRLHSDPSGLERSPSHTLHEENGEDGEDGEDSIEHTFKPRARARVSGLGIATSAPAGASAQGRRVSIQTIPRVPVGAKSPIQSPSISSIGSIGSPPNTGDPLFGGFPKDSAGSTPDLRRERFSPQDGGDYQQYLHSPDTERLRKGAPSLRSAYENDFHPTVECPTAKDFYQSRFSWLSVTVIILCLFSTIFSAIFLGLAWKGPRYGRRITTHGSLTPAAAIVLTSVMAKLIELSFVTSFVAFLGQVLSRRAFMKEQGRGVTLSELSMWRWVVQPGTLITHWETARYSGFTVLGILSLLSAALATLYAPAASALVQPQLKAGKWENMVLASKVRSSFANTNYVKRICETPIRTDSEYGGSTCLQIEHAAQGYHNYQRYLAYWNTASNNGNGTSDQTKRPPGFALMHENTTVIPQWINVIDTKEVSKHYKRAVNNVSLAFPHSGLFQAARDARNDILQPDDLNSEGAYSLRGSVPSPVMHVLCTNLDRDELKPIVYDEWNDELVNITTWTTLQANATTKNATIVDDLFGWTKKDKNGIDYPPVFARLPGPFNTIMNHTTPGRYGRDSIYLLGQGGKDSGANLTGQFVLCQIKVSISPYCSSTYNASGSGGSLEANCEDENDGLMYIKSLTNATEVRHVPDWRDIGFDWANSMSLNTGIMDGDASNSRLLTQLILQKKEDSKGDDADFDLNPTLPSPAEALAVMSGCTLLMSAQDTPFVEFWNYTVTILEEPATQYFNASIKAQQYASGGVDSGSKGFLLVLLLVFLMNIFVLVYFLLHRGLVTDFSEPPNLFALAVNSPPSHLLAGSCGGGPEGKQYVVNWFVNKERDHLYMEPGQHAVAHRHPHGVTRTQPTAKPGGASSIMSAISSRVDKLRDRGLNLRGKKSQALLRPASVVEGEFELEDGERSSRTARQYAKLAKRRSML
ncbi:uncharacterized protein BDR25DRAFT_261867 [Lindgomyces ingoldianus]|uniref:Uncharacterized protein n=1 Tax=Lindgomyces ingoldianus TaxID=673940 RepID=A0ACB6QUZ3_9PLEO|nr:uncharacterized protein BDR25DRAFT_261867 [Lindgomyces ingoldianus]KAF2470715.1 hypothetical protein BDR25DRAFT_261867 [Lindgomyces ingoldianus]